MNSNKPLDISNFFLVGISYRNASAGVRGEFAVNNDQYEKIIILAPDFEVGAFFILSTCNRTEIYGFAESPECLIGLICTQTNGSSATFAGLAYVKKGEGAAAHLFNVGCGLDSQLLGDYEIVGQLKRAVHFSKERGFINCFLDRLVNCVLQSSKTVKNDTLLSGGTVSVSFAAVQYIKRAFGFTFDKKILLVGTGKIGHNTCKNLVGYLNTTNITLINRSEDKAETLAAELNLKHAPFSGLAYHAATADIIITATNACGPIILRSQIENKGPKLIIDLSVPNSVETSVRGLPDINFVNVDMLSKLKDETLQKREAEAPKAKEIIAGHLIGFMEWYNMRKNAPVLNAIKTKLNEIHLQHQLLWPNKGGIYPLISTHEKIQRVVNSAAFKMRLQNQHGCHYIEAINEFMMLAAG